MTENLTPTATAALRRWVYHAGFGLTRRSAALAALDAFDAALLGEPAVPVAGNAADRLAAVEALRPLAQRIVVQTATDCTCRDEPHQNSLHDLAHDLDRILGCSCGCPADMHIGEIGCPCGLPDGPPCAPANQKALADAWQAGWEAGCNDQQYGDENAQPWTPNPHEVLTPAPRAPGGPVSAAAGGGLTGLAKVLAEHRLRVTVCDGCFCCCDEWSIGRGEGAGDAHAAHQAAVVHTWLAERATDEQVRERVREWVARALFEWNMHDSHFVVHGRAGVNPDEDPYTPIADAAVAAFLAAVEAGS